MMLTVAGSLRVGCLALIVVGVACACTPVPPDTFEVKIVNDLPGSVRLLQCNADGRLACATTELGELTRSGGEVVVTASMDDDNPWEVRSASGRLHGCLRLRFGSYPKDVPKVRTSHVTPCTGLGVPARGLGGSTPSR